MPTIKRCVTAFGFDQKGVTRVVSAGMLVGSDDVAYKNFKEYFEDVETHVDEQRKVQDRAEGNAPVEQATAAPGEKRTTIRPSVAPPVKQSAPAAPAGSKPDAKQSGPPASKPSASAGGAAHNATVKKG